MRGRLAIRGGASFTVREASRMRGATMVPTPEAVRRDDQQHAGQADADRIHLNIVLLGGVVASFEGPANEHDGVVHAEGE